ncbi:hypothetical protein HG535_0F04770 [Zygotorulaspora mrakii]|uniref:Glucosidase 2 subunit beta n=1 Tax=Zygotorulaspora mrakii TaxID=42260 RepID=A0A7H9B5J8_ZYGMR|nr:uncharacterized protein HG535_0F04770 [Zygotorulaspora mrakii]QLG73965.1 hypothetical protein HG535_0F04770 [Zygotorulaspora mrakii]
MLYRTLCNSWLLITIAAVLAENSDLAADNSDLRIHGVPPEKQYLYQPIEGTGGKWACLNDPQKLIDISRINDGICDCTDGSDEPGTGSCGDKGPSFYCANEGFLPRYISQSMVNDGVCDCCDCSDELLSPVKPFSHKTDCITLSSSFDKLVQEELREYKDGLGALEKMQTKESIEDSKIVTENLFEEIAVLERDLQANELKLNSTKDKYKEQLKNNNPLYYEFQRLNEDYISHVINASFIKIIGMSEAYEELIQILNNLKDSYTKSLNDRVVNSNVKKYNFMKNQQLKKLSIDSKVEEDQRQELMNFFSEELPATFMEGKIDQPPTYLRGKMIFVDVLITGRTEYTSTVLDAIRKLSELLNDISENYNVNYQDAAVKKSVELYANWLGNHASLEEVQLPEKFTSQFTELKQFVEANSVHILTSGSLEKNSLDAKNIGNHLRFLLSKIKQFFKQDLRHQIETCEEINTQLREQLEEKKSKFASLRETRYGNRNAYIQRLISTGAIECIQGSLSGYLYEICLNQEVSQRELAPPHRAVTIGKFQHIQFDDEQTRKEKYMEHLRIKYPDQMDLMTELVSEKNNIPEYIFGNLHDMSNGLAIRFEDGSKCWNGPKRSATVFVACGSTVEIINVYETSRCNYGIEVKSPIGCNPHFNGFSETFSEPSSHPVVATD